MDRYVTGVIIRKLREKKKMTQEELAEKLYVSGKTVSKWETGNGFPDISLLEPIAKALDISVIELLSGDAIQNSNKSANMAKMKIYVCPVCGNVIQAAGEAVVSCCGIVLPPQEPEDADAQHQIQVEIVEDEYYVSVSHLMEKDHYISFIMAISDYGTQFVKLYPESNAEARLKMSRVKKLYWYCNRHGLFSCPVPKRLTGTR